MRPHQTLEGKPSVSRRIDVGVKKACLAPKRGLKVGGGCRSTNTEDGSQVFSLPEARSFRRNPERDNHAIGVHALQFSSEVLVVREFVFMCFLSGRSMFRNEKNRGMVLMSPLRGGLFSSLLPRTPTGDWEPAREPLSPLGVPGQGPAWFQLS